MLWKELLKNQPFLINKKMLMKYGDEKISSLQEWCFRHNYKVVNEDDFIKLIGEQ